MSTPFLGEVKIVSFNFPPKGWAACNGQLLPINQNQALFSLFGTRYGGDGVTNFALPNLQTRVPFHRGSAFTQGQVGGETAHTLTIAEMPSHPHTLSAINAAANSNSPVSNVFATSTFPLYNTQGADTTLNPATVGNAGASQPHPNLQPYLTLYFIVALQGIFPSQN